MREEPSIVVAGVIAGLLSVAALGGTPAVAPASPASPALPGVAGAEPIAVGAIERTTPAGPVRGYWAKVDLSDPRVEVLVTGPVASGATREGRPVQAVLTPTDRWAKSVGAELAVNANFFADAGRLDASAPAPSPVGGEPASPAWRDGSGARIIGLCISGGVQVSPPREHAGRADPALAVVRSGNGLRAVAGYLTHDQVAKLKPVAAVAGVGGSETDSVPGTLLVEGGKNLGGSARVQPLVRHPRTGIGTTADGRWLVIVVADGRQPSHSIGLTLPELADELIALGAHDAVALDGGGSSAFLHWPGARAEAPATVNKPSDGRFRPVAVSLGVRVARAGTEVAPGAGGQRRTPEGGGAGGE